MDNDKLMFLDGHTQKIKKTLNRISDDFIYIGFLLWEVNKFKYFESKGYLNIIEYAENEFGFKKSQTYNFIGVCEKFSRYTSSGYPSIHIDDKYKDYSFSQLCEIKVLKGDLINKVDSGMSTRQIKEIKKNDIVVDKEKKLNDIVVDNEKILNDFTHEIRKKFDIEIAKKDKLIQDLAHENSELKNDFQKNVPGDDLQLLLKKLYMEWSKIIDDVEASAFDKVINFIKKEFNIS